MAKVAMLCSPLSRLLTHLRVKGPLGPKTLCNACGLRWAKQVRRGGEEAAAAAEATSTAASAEG